MRIKGIGRVTSFRDYLCRQMQNPGFRKAYEEAGIELKIALEVAKARQAAHLTQRQLAVRLKTRQQIISRIENGSQNVTVGTLSRIAQALHRQLEIRFASI